MNSKQRAELQRKLSLNAVPRPPADLAERIKADIPKYLDMEAERSRFSRSVAFNMRLAASVLLAITSIGVAMLFIDRSHQEKSAMMAPRPGAFAPQNRSLPAPATSSEPAEEVHLDISEEPADVPPMRPQNIVQFREQPQVQSQLALNDDKNDAKKEKDREDGDRQAAGAVQGGSYGYFAPQPEAPVVQAVEETKVADVAAAPAPSPAPAVAQPAAAKTADALNETARTRTTAGRRAERVTVTAEAPMVMAPAVPPPPAPVPAPAPVAAMTTGMTTATAKLARDNRADDSIFGISVDPEVFQGIRTTLENGERPRVSAVDVEALVNYFAGPPAKRPRNVSLEVEASPAPIEADGDHAILRFTIDTPAVGTPGLAAPAATDARIDIVLSSHAVASAHRIGANQRPTDESVLHYNTSVTGLYALELQPNLTSLEVVATVRLHYVEGGKPRMATKIVYGKDLAKSWKNSSRRHRLASLGAVWGETLRNMAPGVDVARRAEELATQNPKDPRAKELAAAANASTGGER